MDFTLDDIRRLKAILEEKEKEMLGDFQGKKVLGFSLSKCNMKSKKDGNFITWRAHAFRNKKKAIVHVGRDPQKAEKKIRAYLDKHPDFPRE